MRGESEMQLVIDRPQPLAAAQQVPGSGIKTILFHVHDDDSVIDRLQLVLSLARACGAHVHCLHVTPIEAFSVVDTFGGTFVSQDIVDAFEQEASALRERIETQLKSEDVTWDYEEITGECVPHLVQSAALADLVVTGREPRNRQFDRPAVTLVGDLLAQIRTPLLVTGDRGTDFDPFAPAVVAWNGSYEAANAVRAALPLLKMASKVRVVQFSEEQPRQFPYTGVVEYLSRHGVSTELDCRTKHGGLYEEVLSYAEHQAAGLIVIGGYSHSRAGEFLFGGLTRALLRDCPLALVIAH